MLAPTQRRRPTLKTLALGLGLLLILVSCSDDESSPTPPPVPSLDASGTVGATGGVIESADGRLVLTIPAGALDASTEITITEVSAADVAATAIGVEVIHALAMEPADLIFDPPATLELQHEIDPAKRPDQLIETTVPITVYRSEDLEGNPTRTIAGQEIFINLNTGVTSAAIEMARGSREIVYGLPGSGSTGSLFIVSAGRTIPGLVNENTPFDAEAAMQLSLDLSLVGDITFLPGNLVGCTTSLETGDVVSVIETEAADGARRYDGNLRHTTLEPGDASVDFGLRWEVELDLERLEGDGITTTLGQIFMTMWYEVADMVVAEGGGGGNELASGTYFVGLERELESGHVIRGRPSSPLNNLLALSGTGGSTFHSLNTGDSLEQIYIGINAFETHDWGAALVGARYEETGDESLAWFEFGLGGARLRQWIPEDDEFGFTGILEFNYPVTDGQAFEGGANSGGFVFVTPGWNRVSLIQYNTESGFWDISRQLTQFPEAPGNAFTAAVCPEAGVVIATEGDPGAIYYDSLMVPGAPAELVGYAENSVRQVRTAGDLAFVSNHESDSLTYMTWIPGSPPVIVGHVQVGDGPIGIGATVLGDGNIGVVSTGFYDNTSTITVFGPDGSLLSNTTTDLPPEVTGGVGHAFWLEDQEQRYAVTSTSGYVVVKDLVY